VKKLFVLVIFGALLTSCNNDQGYIPSVAGLDDGQLRALVSQAASDNGVPSALLFAMLQAESGGDANAVSRSGAMGLMQLMPATAAACHLQSAFDPRGNVECGAAYLGQLLARFKNNVTLAVAAYNAGPNAVARYHGVPPYPETQAYVRRVLGLYASAGGDASASAAPSVACAPNGPCPAPPKS